MNRLVVDYLGLEVGSLAEVNGTLLFEFNPAFLATGHELSPLALRAGPGIRSRDQPASARLPGVFEDSLPDQWGTLLMTEWFRRRDVPEHAVTPLMRLAFVGRRAMGALAYRPEESVEPTAEAFSLNALYTAASVAEEGGEIDLGLLAEVGTSAGGARPKAVLALPKSGGERVLPGAGPIPEGFEGWIVKFDTTISGDQGPTEEAYAQMAREAGIDMPETRLLETVHNGKVRRHFAVKRFDRVGPVPVHHITLAGLLHSEAGALDYATLLRATRKVTKDERQVWRAFRRAAFNVLADNRDDHGKNHGFLYQGRQWGLGPAYDLTFGGRIAERGMAVLGERRAPGTTHLLRLAELELLDKHQAAGVIDDVLRATARWTEFAANAGVSKARASEVDAALRSLRSPSRKA